MPESTDQANVPRKTHRVYSRAFKQQVVRETLAPGASVAAVARQHALSANVVFEWRRLHRLGLLPLQVVDESVSATPIANASARYNCRTATTVFTPTEN